VEPRKEEEEEEEEEVRKYMTKYSNDSSRRRNWISKGSRYFRLIDGNTQSISEERCRHRHPNLEVTR
jgi:hypothetical protein